MQMNRRVATYSLYTIGLLFIIYIICQAWPELLVQLPHLDLYFIVLSIIAFFLHTLIGCGLLNKIFITSGLTVSYAHTCKIFYLSQPAKYLPGVIWGFALQASLVKSEGAMKKVTLSNIKYLLFIVSFFFFFSISILLFEKLYLVSLILIVAAYIFTSLIKNFSFIDILPTYFRKLVPSLYESENRKMDVPTLQIFVICMTLFITYALSISSITLSFYQFSFYESLEVAIYQCLAWVVGIVTFVVPAGMGVREAAFLLISSFTDNFSTEQMQAIAILTRSIQMFQDIALSLVVLVLVKLKVI